LGTTLAGVAGAYAACTSAADVVRGLPQSEQYRAVASFSRPQNEQNVLEDEEAGVAPDGVVRSEAGKEVKPRWSRRGMVTSKEKTMKTGEQSCLRTLPADRSRGGGGP